MVQVAVLGGGISGLAAAYYVRQLLPASAVTNVTLLEASHRLGGWMESVQNSSGSLHEIGPRTLRSVSYLRVYIVCQQKIRQCLINFIDCINHVILLIRKFKYSFKNHDNS